MSHSKSNKFVSDQAAVDGHSESESEEFSETESQAQERERFIDDGPVKETERRVYVSINNRAERKAAELTLEASDEEYDEQEQEEDEEEEEEFEEDEATPQPRPKPKGRKPRPSKRASNALFPDLEDDLTGIPEGVSTCHLEVISKVTKDIYFPDIQSGLLKPKRTVCYTVLDERHAKLGYQAAKSVRGKNRVWVMSRGMQPTDCFDALDSDWRQNINLTNLLHIISNKGVVDTLVRCLPQDFVDPEKKCASFKRRFYALSICIKDWLPITQLMMSNSRRRVLEGKGCGIELAIFSPQSAAFMADCNSLDVSKYPSLPPLSYDGTLHKTTRVAHVLKSNLVPLNSGPYSGFPIVADPYMAKYQKKSSKAEVVPPPTVAAPARSAKRSAPDDVAAAPEDVAPVPARSAKRSAPDDVAPAPKRSAPEDVAPAPKRLCLEDVRRETKELTRNFERTLHRLRELTYQLDDELAFTK